MVVDAPKLGTHGILYNPNTNNEQNIMLDMLHGMKTDPKYKQYRSDFSDAFIKANGQDLKNDWENHNKETKGNNDGFEQFKNNWVDGQIRGLMYEGTDADFKKQRYWKDAKKVYLKDETVNNKYSALKNYLQTGK